MKHARFFFLGVIFIVFFLVSYFLLDPDLGWHLRMGELILKSGIPLKDPFTYSMKDYPFIDHEWLSNVFLYSLYSSFGKFVSALIWAAIASSAVMIPIRHWYKWTFSLGLLATTILINFSGIRIQIISWLFFSVFFCIMRNEKVWEKVKWMVPVFFLVWVNLHGSFSFGLLSLSIFVVLRSIEKRKIIVSDILVFISSLFGSFINPYGPHIYKEIYDQVTDPYPRFLIKEWYPGIATTDIPMWIFFALSFSLFVRYFKKLSLPIKGIYITTLFMGLSSVRHIPLWIMMALPLLNLHTEYLFKELKKIPLAQERFLKLLSIFTVLIFFIFIMQSTIKIKESINRNEDAFYPKKAIEYLKIHPTSGNYFTLNEWAGYFEWKLPEKKMFDDGRMPSWNWKAPEDQTDSAFHDYVAILQKKLSFSVIQKKYDIDTVVILNSEKLQRTPEDLTTMLRLAVDRKKKGSTLYKEVEKAGMRIVYKDEVSVIYRFP